MYWIIFATIYFSVCFLIIFLFAFTHLEVYQVPLCIFLTRTTKILTKITPEVKILFGFFTYRAKARRFFHRRIYNPVNIKNVMFCENS